MGTMTSRPLGAEALGTLCMRVLERMGIGVIACTERLVVLAATGTASKLMAEFASAPCLALGARLPEPIAQAAIACWEDEPSGRPVPRRVENEGSGRAIYVASDRVDDLEPVAVVVRIHPERLADAELFEALRNKFDLNARDRRVIALLRQRRSNSEIASALSLTIGTVKVYVHELFEKLDVHSRGELLSVLERIREGS